MKRIGGVIVPDSARDVDQFAVGVDQSTQIFLSAARWHDRRANDGKHDLSAVRVARKRQSHARVIEVFHKIGIVRDEQPALVWFQFFHRQIEFRLPAGQIVDTAQPQAVAFAFQPQSAVEQK